MSMLQIYVHEEPRLEILTLSNESIFAQMKSRECLSSTAVL